MKEEQFLEIHGNLQSVADERGLLNTLDIFIHFFLGSSAGAFNSNYHSILYRKYRRLYNSIYSWFQPEVKLRPGVIIMFPTEPTHVNQMIPVAQHLTAEGRSLTFVTTRPKIYRMVRDSGISIKFLTGHFSSSAKNLLLPMSEVEDVGEHNSTGISKHLSLLYSELLFMVDAFKELLVNTGPAYVLVGNDLTWEGRLMVRIGQLIKCRTGVIQHGLLGREVLNRYHVVDDFFVYGDAFQAVLEKDGLTGVEIVVVGAPYLDGGFDRDLRAPDPIIKQKLKLRNDGFVLIALSGHGLRTSFENYQLTLLWIERLIRTHPELEFVIRLHRKERMKHYSIFPRSQRKRIIDRRRARRLPENIFRWLKGCSCVITGTSTVAYEAMLCSIPVISVDPLKEFAGIDFITERVVEVVHSYEELDSALLKVNGKLCESNEFIRNIIDVDETPASRRICEYIASIKG